MLDVLIDHPRLIPPCEDLLHIPGKTFMPRPLHRELTLLVTHLSGKRSKVREFQKSLSNSLHSLGDLTPDINTTQLYDTEREVDSYNPYLKEILDFLTYLFTLGYSYIDIATARSTLSALIHLTDINSISEHPLIKRLAKGIFNSRSPQPHYQLTWDNKSFEVHG